MSSTLLIAIPMKDPSRAKTRLSDCLPPCQRRGFALALFLRTLDCIKGTRSNVKVVVVTESSLIATMAIGRGAHVLFETVSEGLNEACRKAEKWAVDHRHSRMAILPADLARLTSEDVARFENRF